MNSLFRISNGRPFITDEQRVTIRRAYLPEEFSPYSVVYDRLVSKVKTARCRIFIAFDNLLPPKTPWLDEKLFVSARHIIFSRTLTGQALADSMELALGHLVDLWLMDDYHRRLYLNRLTNKDVSWNYAYPIFAQDFVKWKHGELPALSGLLIPVV